MLSGLEDKRTVRCGSITRTAVNLLDDQCVELGKVVDNWRWSGLEVLLLPLLGDGVLVTEDEVHL